MAAAWLRQQHPDWHIVDAGVAPGLGPSNGLASRVMQEQGLTVPVLPGKSWTLYRQNSFDHVLVLSKLAAAVMQREAPHWPVTELLMDDPAVVQGTEAFRLEAYRATAQELREKLLEWWESAGFESDQSFSVK